MNREFLINIFFLLFINLLIKPFYVFGIDIGVQNAVGPKEYGVYFALFNFCFIFQIVGDMGIQNYNSTYISKNREFASEYMSKLILTKLVLSFFYLAVLWLFAKLLAYPNTYLIFIFYIGINQIILSYILYLRTNISGTGHYRLDSFLSVIDKFVLIFILGYLLWFSPLEMQTNFKIEWFIWAQTIALLITLSIVIFAIIMKIGIEKLGFSLHFSKSFLRKSFPYALIIILMTTYTRMDGIMLERILKDEGYQAGIYAASYRLLDASNMIGYLFASLLLPMFSNLLGQKKSINSLLSISFKLIFFGSIVLVSFVLINANSIMSELYTEGSNPYYAKVLQIVMLSFLAISISYVFGTLLTSNGNTKPMNILFAIGIVLNIVLNLLLIKEYKAYGAGIATLVTQFFVMFGQILLVIKIFRISISKSIILEVLLILIMIPMIFYGLSKLNIEWWLNLPFGIILSILVSLLIKFIDIKEIKNSIMPINPKL